MTGSDRDQRLRRAMVLGGDRGASGGCLDDLVVAALVDGALEPEARATALEHVARCEACRSAVASVARALADRDVSRAVAALRRPGGRRWLRVALPAVAAAGVVLLLSWPSAAPDDTPTHRAPTITAGTSPAPISPVGAVRGARTLRWTAVDGADRYRVTLFDAGGRVLYETELGEPVAALPDSVVLRPGQPYLWRVEARIGFDRWTASELVEFSLARNPSQ